MNAPEQNDTNENTSTASDAEYERSIGHAMWIAGEMLKRLRAANWLGDASLAKAAGAMQGTLDALDARCAPSDEELMFGTSDEDAAARESAGVELTAMNQRLAAHLSLAISRQTVRRIQARGE